MAARKYYPTNGAFIQKVLRLKDGKTLRCLLRQGRLTYEKTAWILKAAIDCLPEIQYNMFILPNCDVEHLRSVFKHLLQNRKWKSVGLAFENKVGLEYRRMVLDLATSDGNMETVVEHLLPHYGIHERDSVMRSLVSDKKWKEAGALAKLGIGDDSFLSAVKRAVNCSANADLIEYILPHCGVEPRKLEPVLQFLTQQGRWEAVGFLLDNDDDRGCCSRAVNEACANANEQNLIDWILPQCNQVTDRVVNQLIGRKFWRAVELCLIKESVRGPQLEVIVDKVVDPEHASDTQFLLVVDNWPDKLVIDIFFKIVERYRLLRPLKKLVKQLSLNSFLSELITNTVEDQGSENLDLFMQRSDACHLVGKEIISFINIAAPGVGTSDFNPNSKLVKQLRDWCQKLDASEARDQLESQSFHSFFRIYQRCRQAEYSDRLFLTILASVPIFPTIQNLVLMIMVREGLWNVVGHAWWSEVWEQNRRAIFRAAVKESQWQVVEEMSDHTLYDDQRGWALKKATDKKQWHVLMKLAKYGLSKDESMRVYCRIAKQADWNDVLKTMEAGADAIEVTEMLANPRTSGRRSMSKNEMEMHRHKLVKLQQVTNNLQTDRRPFAQIIRQRDWKHVLFRLQRKPSHKGTNIAAKAAINDGAWDVLLQLIRFGMTTKSRNKLFWKMVQQKQWGVCRLLIESKVDIAKLKPLLSKLIQAKQWILVALLMSYPVDDYRRKMIAQEALKAKEGSLFWECLQSMDNNCLSIVGRKRLFNVVMEKEMWQAVKPLVEWKDSLGLSHRDEVLVKAIDQHQWDVVDHCIRNNADVNVLLADGCTPLQKYAHKRDWVAVRELVLRGGDQFKVTDDGDTILNLAAKAQEWVTVKTLIEFHGAVNQSDRGGFRCPMHYLIEGQQADIIDTALIWHGDVISTVSIDGETTLHAVCASGKPKAMYYLIARGCDPLALTENGKSVLMYAVEHEKYPQKMLAECINLGLSIYQPKISDEQYVPKTLLSRMKGKRAHTSPLEYALVHEQRVVADMLYESGACSNKEIFRLHQGLKGCGNEVPHMEKTWPFLDRVFLTPRSLASQCRLVIARSRGVCRRRHRDTALHGLDPKIKDYILFADLRDPMYGWK